MKPKLTMVVNQVTKIPLYLHVDGVEHLIIYETGAIHLMGKKVGSDPALADALLAGSLPVTGAPSPKTKTLTPAPRKPRSPAEPRKPKAKPKAEPKAKPKPKPKPKAKTQPGTFTPPNQGSAGSSPPN